MDHGETNYAGKFFLRDHIRWISPPGAHTNREFWSLIGLHSPVQEPLEAFGLTAKSRLWNV